MTANCLRLFPKSYNRHYEGAEHNRLWKSVYLNAIRDMKLITRHCGYLIFPTLIILIFKIIINGHISTNENVLIYLNINF